MTRVSGWIIFTICFTALLVGMGSAFTAFQFYRAGRRMKEAELRGLGSRAAAHRGDRKL